jgi:hypothetical protein
MVNLAMLFILETNLVRAQRAFVVWFESSNRLFLFFHVIHVLCGPITSRRNKTHT